jgi:nicotinamidase-related amidase
MENRLKLLLQAEKSVLLLVDVQARLLPSMAEPDGVVERAGILLKAAQALGVPILASEQYPAGLGPTVPALRALLPEGAVMAKMRFSCAGDPAIADRLQSLRRPQVVLVGIEAHVCVLQTAMDLMARGHAPFVVADAVSSRAPANKEVAIARMREAGITVATTEMVVFEWLGQAGTPVFKTLSKLIR